MVLVMVNETDLNRIDVSKDFEVLDATALGRRLGFKRDTVLAYLSRRNFRRIPRPNRKLAMGAVWFERSVQEWERKAHSSTHGPTTVAWGATRPHCRSSRFQRLDRHRSIRSLLLSSGPYAQMFP